eukprot:1160285-Pelagomonas_calceolata.AAC.2
MGNAGAGFNTATRKQSRDAADSHRRLCACLRISAHTINQAIKHSLHSLSITSTHPCEMLVSVRGALQIQTGMP